MPRQNRFIKKVLIFSAFFYVSFYVSASSAALAPCAAVKAEETAQVKTVYDGDTVQLQDGRKVRLIGIDTPEIYSRKRAIAEDVKARGEAARRALVQRLQQSGQRVLLAYGHERFDRYGRTLAHVYLDDGTNLHSWLITQGHAIAFTTPPNDRMSPCYRQQEKTAREAGRGIWQMPQYQLKATRQLHDRSGGFHRLAGTVTAIRQNRKRLTIKLDRRVDININKDDLQHFDQYWLQGLEGKAIVVRGWLRAWTSDREPRQRVRFAMRLRHPDSIRLQK